ncbi:putative galacturonosyltransferase 14 [Platanthera guangdongensis]|uniref:Galacturonosyltransferase 14 n=1 Tax=Platanthera guangdongensis TaxID=2320717 RepID=A0ABR2M1N8_9ASPA
MKPRRDAYAHNSLPPSSALHLICREEEDAGEEERRMQLRISPSMRSITISSSYGFLFPFAFILTAVVTLEGVDECSSLGFDLNALDSTAEDDESSSGDVRRPPFDLNLAVVLAGFAFEAYTSPADFIML